MSDNTANTMYQVTIEHWDDDGLEIIDAETVDEQFDCYEDAVQHAIRASRNADKQVVARVEKIAGIDKIEPLSGYRQGALWT